MHRYFQINEEQLKYLIETDIRRIKSWKYYNNFQKFSKKYPDHTYEFNWFNPKETGLNNEILLDECANYIHDKHPLFIYFRNGKSLSENLIPVAVHRYKPFLLDNKIRLKISENSLHKIFSFIKNNYYAIVEYANGRIGYEDALNCFKMQALNEQMLVEMPIFNDYEFTLIDESSNVYGMSIIDWIETFTLVASKEKKIVGIDTRKIDYKKMNTLIDYLGDRACEKEDPDAMRVVFLKGGRILEETEAYVKDIDSFEFNKIWG